LAQNGSFFVGGGQNRGRSGASATLTPSEFVQVLGVVTSVPLLAKIDQSIALSKFAIKAPLNPNDPLL